MSVVAFCAATAVTIRLRGQARRGDSEQTGHHQGLFISVDHRVRNDKRIITIVEAGINASQRATCELIIETPVAAGIGL